MQVASFSTIFVMKNIATLVLLVHDKRYDPRSTSMKPVGFKSHWFAFLPNCMEKEAGNGGGGEGEQAGENGGREGVRQGGRAGLMGGSSCMSVGCDLKQHLLENYEPLEEREGRV